jgi:Ras-related protein Rab-11A
MNQNQITYKVILLGESAVGKTSIINRLAKDTFSNFTKSTINEFYIEKELEIKENKILFQIWDTAGQEKYRSIVKNYYKGAVAAILVYDITNLESFKQLDDFWLKEIMNFNPNISMY